MDKTEKCTCLHCKRSEHIRDICKKLSEEDSKFIMDIYDEFCSANEDLDFIRSGISGQYFSRNDLKDFLEITDDELYSLVKHNRKS